MKRVLFVDDEGKALEDLKIMLQVQEFPWEVAYATSGKSALDLMAEKPFDVIISDIRMPEMDGAALLKIVCERFPGAVRIVVCSQEEMNGALRAVPVAHQFLLKPCDPHMLRVAVERHEPFGRCQQQDAREHRGICERSAGVAAHLHGPSRKAGRPERVGERSGKARRAGYFDCRENSSVGEFGVFRIAARNFHDEYRRELSGNRHAPEPRLIGRGVSRF
jgi:CheY-like chemotaxis protein